MTNSPYDGTLPPYLAILGPLRNAFIRANITLCSNTAELLVEAGICLKCEIFIKYTLHLYLASVPDNRS